MTQADNELARKIARLLDDEAARLEPAAVERLAAARKAALAQYREQPSSVWGPAFAGKVGSSVRHSNERRRSALRLIVLATTVVGALAVSLTWQAKKPSIADIDAALLTDDLPINAYLDKGFDLWIKRVSH